MKANPLWFAVRLGALLTLLLILGACGGSSIIGCRFDCAQKVTQAEVLYVGSAGQIQIFPINTDSGALGSPTIISGLNTAGSGTATPSGKFLYVSDSKNNQIDGYNIDSSTGALTPMAGSPFPLGAVPNSAGGLGIDPGGKFLYATDFYGFNVLAFSINSSNGSLAPVPGSPFGSGFYPAVAVVDPTTQFLNVADIGIGSLGGISSYTIDSNGALTAGASGALVLLLNTGVADIAMHRTGKFLYASTGILPSDSGVMLISVDQNSGALTQVGSTPFPTGLAPEKITMHPQGMFLYTANIGDGTISGFRIDNASGMLTPVSGSPFPIFTVPPPGGLIFFDVAIDSSGQFLYADDPLTSNILGFRIDSLTGSLTALGQTPRSGQGLAGFTIVGLP